MASTSVTPAPAAAAAAAPTTTTSLDGKEEEDANKNLFGCNDERTIWTRIWQGTAGTCFALNIAAMAIEASVVAVIAGIVACCVAPLVIYRQFELQGKDTLRQVQNELRDEVTRMHGENVKLSGQVTKLTNEVRRLKQEEEKLSNITKEQGSNVDSFVQLIKENRSAIDELKAAVKADLTQTLVAACIESDFDGSGNFSDQEIKILELRVKNLPGIKVNHQLFVETVHKSDRRLGSVLELLNHLDRGDLADEYRIFRFDEDHLHEQQQQKC